MTKFVRFMHQASGAALALSLLTVLVSFPTAALLFCAAGLLQVIAGLPGLLAARTAASSDHTEAAAHPALQ